MEYLKDLNKCMEVNKEKSVSLEIRKDFNAALGQCSQLIFIVDGVEMPYIFPTIMLLSVMQLHCIENEREMEKQRLKYNNL